MFYNHYFVEMKYLWYSCYIYLQPHFTHRLSDCVNIVSFSNLYRFLTPTETFWLAGLLVRRSFVWDKEVLHAKRSRRGGGGHSEKTLLSLDRAIAVASSIPSGSYSFLVKQINTFLDVFRLAKNQSAFQS